MYDKYPGMQFKGKLHLSLYHFLAHLVMSLCNHAIRHRHHHCHWHWHLYSHPSEALIIETSYLGDICTYAPSLCT